MRCLPPALLLAVLLPAAAPAAPLPDVLEAPARPTTLAPTRLLNGISRAGPRLVAVGQRGHIIYSDDGGQRWRQAAVPVRSDLVAVTFLSPRQGWAVGHDGVVLASGDGGTTWRRQFDGRQAAEALRALADRLAPTATMQETPAPEAQETGRELSGEERLAAELRRMADQGADKPFLDICFLDENTGYAVGAFGLLFHSSDGGRTWEPWLDHADNPRLLHLYAIENIGDDVFVVGEQGLILKLEKGTQRFRALASPYKGSFFGVTGHAGMLLVYGLRGNLFRSTDGGAHWQKIDTGLLAGLTGGQVLDTQRVVLVSQGGDVLLSRDDGASFQSLPTLRRFPFTALTPGAEGALALTGLRGVFMQPLPPAAPATSARPASAAPHRTEAVHGRP